MNVDSVQVPLRGTLKVALLFMPSALLHFAPAFARPVGSAVALDALDADMWVTLAAVQTSVAVVN